MDEITDIILAAAGRYCKAGDGCAGCWQLLYAPHGMACRHFVRGDGLRRHAQHFRSYGVLSTYRCRYVGTCCFGGFFALVIQVASC